MIHLVIFLCGVLFSIGLGLSGMTQPSKVVGFLDFTSKDWDPSLILVMAGAVFVYFIAQRFTLRRDGPALVPGGFQLPTRADIEPAMIVGNVLFGIGWGMIGFCPGPALTSSVTGNPAVLIFLVSMAVGMYVYGAIDTRLATREPDGGAGIHEHAMLAALEAEEKRHHLP